ncbi:MAG: H4MPT-linked C1 transfer pathway protein [Gammaproteobacteria bacterium]|nr:H4MPT-linked C1 transfer pathway protein [Gammaproteobacteria bacterium]
MSKQSSYVSGWDIGGAHLKVARCDHDGQLLEVRQYLCPLWQGLEHLENAIIAAQNELNNHHDLAAITMTGELVDLFANREIGVAEILNCVTQLILSEQCQIYAGEKGWLSVEDAKREWQYVASRNWQASANFVASKITNSVFIDLGSTTCDIIPIISNQVATSAYDDHHRQISRELLYTGTIRTPLIALTSVAPFDGQLISLAAELFATTGDVWVMLDQLNPNDILDNSADGKPWNKANCVYRLARLLGTDAHEVESASWQLLAKWFAQQQIHQITNAILQVLSCHPHQQNHTIVGAGIGRFIIKQCAAQLGYDYIDFATLCQPELTAAADHAPAVAIALLAWQQLT